MELWLIGLVTGLIVGYFFGRVHVGRQTSGRLDRLRREYDELAEMLEATSMTAPAATLHPAADEKQAGGARRDQALDDRNSTGANRAAGATESA